MRPAGTEGDSEAKAGAGGERASACAAGVVGEAPGLDPPEAPAGSWGRRSWRSPRRATATLTTDVLDDLETQLAKKRTFKGVVFLLATAECAIEITFEGATPTGSHKP